ncbi:MAG: hypothetical protein H0W69_03030 [Gemmatimonadaceae bacterium]|nr:hypothetical protein [Gemmatimonadaceae bacterium]
MSPARNPYLRIGAVVLLIATVTFLAQSVLKRTGDAPILSSVIPTAENMDSLGRYLAPLQATAVPVLDNVSQLRIDNSDPFRSETDSTSETVPQAATILTPPTQYVLSAILISTDNRLAVVNETLVSIGTVLPGGTRVTAIEPDHIVIVAPSGIRRMLTVKDANG